MTHGTCSLVSSAQKWRSLAIHPMSFCAVRHISSALNTLFSLKQTNKTKNNKQSNKQKPGNKPTTVLSANTNFCWWAHWRQQGLGSWYKSLSEFPCFLSSSASRANVHQRQWGRSSHTLFPVQAVKREF